MGTLRFKFIPILEGFSIKFLLMLSLLLHGDIDPKSLNKYLTVILIGVAFFNMDIARSQHIGTIIMTHIKIYTIFEWNRATPFTQLKPTMDNNHPP